MVVSVIVPVYNVEKYLRQCVESLTGQTCADEGISLEIILVDDGSTDRSGAICDEYQEKDSRVRVIHKSNQGLMAAWQDGVKCAAGQYLMFIDSDDWLDLEAIAQMAKHLTGAGNEIVCCNYLQERSNRSEQCRQRLAAGAYDKERLQKEVYPEILGNEQRIISFSRCMKLISKELFVQNMQYCDGRIIMGEDVTITLPALLSADRIVILQDSFFYHYRFLEQSMAHVYRPGLTENIFLLGDVIRRIAEDYQLPDGTAQAEREYLYLLFLILKNEMRGAKRGYQARIRQLCKKEEIAQMIRVRKLSPQQMNNKIMYLVLRHPNAVVIWVVKWILSLNDRK